MRNKQRPLKSFGHKSVTSVIKAPEITFQNEERHGVMRLAFFENNDITPETWKDFDFNTLSTLILNRNIHKDLQERDRQPTVRPGTSQSLPSAYLDIPQQHQPIDLHQNEFSPQHELDYGHEPIYSPPPVSAPRSTSASRAAVARRPPSFMRAQQPPIPRPAHESTKPAIGSKPANLQRAASKSQQQHLAQQHQSNTNIESKTFLNHSGQFLCDEPDCGKTFPSLRKLRHHKVVHSNDFPFICQFEGCGKRFKRKFGIDLHSTTHFDLDPEMYEKTSNEKSLTLFGRRMQYSMCKPCNQKFKTVHDYQDHMLRHGKEPFKCQVEDCGQTFSIWKSFQKHRASHYFNYFCRMDGQCDHSTSNLQLLKLHIYCVHFRRTLPENATLSSKNYDVHDDVDDHQIDDNEEIEREDQEQESIDQTIEEPQVFDEQEVDDPLSISQESDVSTPRRDPRLRRNPPRSSTFGQQDYAAINNGSSYAKLTSPQPLKRARQSGSSSQMSNTDKKPNRSPAKVLPKRACSSITSTGSQQSTPEKKPKLPLKVLPKRSAQRLPMSLIAAEEGSTEDDDRSDTSSARNERGRNERESAQSDHRFKCHLCDYQFAVRFQLTKHLSTHLELRPDWYTSKGDREVINLTERRRLEFYCEKCQIKFEKSMDLDAHMRKHSARPYVCSFCSVPSTFKLAKQYLSHLYEHRFVYRCMMEPDCDFTINRKDALKLHIFRIHMNQQLPAYIENYASMADCNE